MTTRARNAILAFCIPIAAVGWGWHQQLGILRQHAQCAAAEAALAEAQRQQLEATQQLDGMRKELAIERSQRDAALVSAAAGSRQSAAHKPAPDLAQPPATWPSWDSMSPYIWVRKDELARLGLQAFTTDGLLTQELATLLDVQPAARTAINDLARRLLAEWRANESQQATRTDQHPSNIGQGPGPTVTVRVPPLPELAARLRQEFRLALTDTLGQQRADLLAGFARHDIDSELGPEPAPNQPPVRAKTYSVRRDGHNFQIAVNIPSGSSVRTTSEDWRKNIPAHLQAPFEETFGEPDVR